MSNIVRRVKKLYTTILVLLTIGVSGQDTLTFKVKGLVCSFCAHGLNKGIGKLPFTDEKSIWVDIQNQIVKVAVNKDYKADPHLKQTIELIKETGYEVDKVFLNKLEETINNGVKNGKRKKESRRTHSQHRRY